jgi:hypothetical protein
MRIVKLELSSYDDGDLEVTVGTYDSTRNQHESWRTEETWRFAAGSVVGLGEPSTMWECFADDTIRASGRQLLLPFE